MEKIVLTTQTATKAELVGNLWLIEAKLNEIIDLVNDKNCSPITCPFNTLIDQLAKRTKRLEFYDKQHRKEHSKHDR